MHDNYSDYENEIRSDLTYTNTLSSQQVISTIKIVLLYAGILILWLVVAKLYMNFGSQWIVPAVSTMWLMGAVTTYYIKEEREGTIKETKFSILGFLLFLFLYRGVIQLIAPISSEQMGAALNITVPAASGMAAAGFLQNILIIVSILTPIGFLTWCAQKFKVYHGRATKQEAFQRIKGIRNNPHRL